MPRRCIVQQRSTGYFFQGDELLDARLDELVVVLEHVLRLRRLRRQRRDVLHVRQGLAQVVVHHGQQLDLVVVLDQRRALRAQRVDLLCHGSYKIRCGCTGRDSCLVSTELTGCK